MADTNAYVMGLVREGDQDRYLSVLYAPQQHRAALATLFAFNVEIARVRDLIHEALPGEIRLQWWRDAIAGANPTTGNPLADALIEVIRQYGLPAEAFDNYIEARIFDLYDDPIIDRTMLEGYCGETASTMIQLAAMILDRSAAPQCASLAGHAGCAQAIAGLLRSFPIHRRRGQCFIPGEVLAAVGSDHASLLSQTPGENETQALLAMVALGREHVARFERNAVDLPQSLRPAFLPAGLAGAYLDRIARAPLSGGSDIPVLKKHWIMFRRATRGW